MIIQSLIAILATYWFGVIFNVKGKKLIYASIGGGISWFVFVFSLEHNITNAVAYFIASIFLTIYAEVFARILQTPVTTILVPGLIPLVPGGGIFYTMLYTVQNNTTKAILKGLDTLFAAGALAFGVVFVSSITKIIKDIQRGKSIKEM